MIKEFYVDYDNATVDMLEKLSDAELKELYNECNVSRSIADTNQQNRKIAMNSLYGALGNIHFRYYNLDNATAITTFGQLAIQWSARKIDEYMNRVCGTDGKEYVFYIDTDSNYTELTELIENKIGLHRFKTTNQLVDFIDKFAKTKIEPMLAGAFDQLKDYLNSYENKMAMDREAIACPPLGHKGIGAFWNAKKRYALNVWDMEGVRYDVPKLKIMGLETQQSSTPKAVQNALKESIRLIVQDGEEALQKYFEEFEKEYREIPYRQLASVSTANNIKKYDDGTGYPGSGCTYHIKGVLAYHRAIKGTGLPLIQEGEKVYILPLKAGNPFHEKCIAWSSGTDLPAQLLNEVLKFLDYGVLFHKTFVKPLSTICTSSHMNYEQVFSLEDMFG